MSKNVVHYKPQAGDFIKIGYRASVVPIDHPDTFLVDNGKPAITSEVQSYNPATGVFETKNSRYIPA